MAYDWPNTMNIHTDGILHTISLWPDSYVQQQKRNWEWKEQTPAIEMRTMISAKFEQQNSVKFDAIPWIYFFFSFLVFYFELLSCEKHRVHFAHFIRLNFQIYSDSRSFSGSIRHWSSTIAVSTSNTKLWNVSISLLNWWKMDAILDIIVQ